MQSGSVCLPYVVLRTLQQVPPADLNAVYRILHRQFQVLVAGDVDLISDFIDLLRGDCNGLVRGQVDLIRNRSECRLSQDQ